MLFGQSKKNRVAYRVEYHLRKDRDWIVYRSGNELKEFPTKSKASKYARRKAKNDKPSRLLILKKSGYKDCEHEYG